jgi:hypothetical protein
VVHHLSHYRSSFAAFVQEGDKVEYRPIGGASDNVSHSTGEITHIVEEDGVSCSPLRARTLI